MEEVPRRTSLAPLASHFTFDFSKSQALSRIFLRVPFFPQRGGSVCSSRPCCVSRPQEFTKLTLAPRKLLGINSF